MSAMTGMRPMSAPTGKGNRIPKGYSQGSMAQFTPEQMQLFQQMFSQVGPDSFLSKLAGGDQGQFDQLEAPALKQFSGLQGNLASRFSGMGTGARRSSGFQNTMNQASSDFAGQLQSQRMGLQRQALMDLMGISESLLGQRPYENFLVPQQKSFGKEFLTAMAPGIGQGLGSFATGGILKKLGFS